jgi:hypothetical protein
MALSRRRVLLLVAGGARPLSLTCLRKLGWPGERPISEYSTLDDAMQAGAVARGWIPNGLPASARSLWEQHDLDTNQVFLRFELPEGDRCSLADGLRLRELSQDEIRRLDVPRPWSRTLWFEGLIQQAPANDAALNARVYVSQRNDYPALVAVDRLSEAVYVWTAR